ncbi:MAG: Rpn family recombination-promoting nuclease/putative transposase [Planctomycetia bacterium]
MPILPASNSHDSFFKQAFGQQDYARSFLLSTLPAEIAQCLNLSVLEPSPASFVDENLRQAHSDLLFRTQLADGSDAAVYLLFEHKSAADPMTVFQMLRYILKINEQRLRDQLDLCCIIPLVVYHGQNPWNAPTSLRQLIPVPDALAPFIPDFSLQIMDLGQIQDTVFQGDPIFRATILVFKYIMRPEIIEKLFEIFKILRNTGELQLTDSVRLILNYLVSGSDRVPSEILLQEIRKGLSNNRESIMPTIAEQWIEEGRAEGLLAGKLEGRLEGRLEGKLEGRLEGKLEGRIEGLSMGQLIGSIRAYQEILGMQPDTIELLNQQSLSQLAELEQQLRTQLGVSTVPR